MKIKSIFKKQCRGFGKCFEIVKKNNVRHLFLHPQAQFMVIQKFSVTENFPTSSQIFICCNKKIGENIIHSYSAQYKFVTCEIFHRLWSYGRPDMALFKFVASI